MGLNFNGFWKSSNYLYKVENNIDVYRYLKNDEWENADGIYMKLGWDDDFDFISNDEAKKIMEEIDKR